MTNNIEDFFSVGSAKIEGNPYAQSNIENVKKEVEQEKKQANEAQTLDLGIVGSALELSGSLDLSSEPLVIDSGTGIEIDLSAEITPEDALEERAFDESSSLPFDIITESNNSTLEINLNEPTLTEDTSESYVDTTVGLSNPVENYNPMEVVEEQLSGISEKIDSKQILENSTKTVVSTATVTGDVKLNISDSTASEIKEDGAIKEVESSIGNNLDNVANQPEVDTNINKLPNLDMLANLMMDEDEEAKKEFEGYKPPVSPTASIVDEPIKEEPKVEYKAYQPNVGQEKHNSDFEKEIQNPEPQYQTHQSQEHQDFLLSSNNTNQNMYNTDKGIKLRKDATTPKGTEFSIDFGNFNHDSSVTGDAFVESLKVIAYNGNQKMLKYTLRVKDGVTVDGTQFGIDPNTTDETVKGLKHNVISLTGKWNDYKGTKGVKITSIAEPKNPDVNPYLVGEDKEFYESSLTLLISLIRRPWLREAVSDILFKDDFISLMRKTPAAERMHDSGKEGLYLHTVKVATLANEICKLYPMADSDVVISSAILHDIGKVVELKDGSYTELGCLVGHIVLGYSIVRDKFNNRLDCGLEIEDNVVKNILHCILSHHGKLEWGSPVVPKTIEASILHKADSAEAEATHFTETFSGQETRKNSGMFRTDIFKL